MPVDLHAYPAIISLMEGTGRFPRREKLSLKRDFDRVFAEGRSAADGNLVVYLLQTQLGHPRLGLAVGKGIGKAAARNRVKRLIREAYRLNRNRLPESADVVVIARKSVRADFGGITASLVNLAGRLMREKE
jgi:ribonuclease P protein component